MNMTVHDPHNHNDTTTTTSDPNPRSTKAEIRSPPAAQNHTSTTPPSRPAKPTMKPGGLIRARHPQLATRLGTTPRKRIRGAPRGGNDAGVIREHSSINSRPRSRHKQDAAPALASASESALATATATAFERVGGGAQRMHKGR